MGVATAAAAAVSLVGGAMGASEEAKGRKSAERMAAQGVEAFRNVDLPDIEKQKILLENPELIGELAPEMQQALNLDPSAMEDVAADQALEDAQMQSLEGISEVAEGGLTEADIAASREISRGVAQDAEARRKAVLNNMAQRGVLGSGMELAAQLQAQQQAVDTQSQAADRLTQQAQARALQALQQQGTMAGDIRRQDVAEQTAAARARDAINQWNLANQQQVANQNVQQRNLSQQQNLAARQAQEDQRARLANQQQMYNKELQQQQFQNQMQQASGLAGQYQQGATRAQQAGSAAAKQIGGIAGGISNIIGSFGQKDDDKEGK